MSRLSHDLKHLCIKNPEGSYGTQAARLKVLQQSALQLREMGFTQLPLRSLKPKHIEKLVERWHREGISPGTMKNRMSHVRWWADKTGRSSVVRSNDNLGIERRSYAGNDIDKSRTLEPEKLSQIQNPYVIASLRLQEAFGLRREESIKINPKTAEAGVRIELKGSWCKGGRPRTLEIRTDKQREAWEYAKSVAKSGALIPSDKNYIQQLKVFEYQTAKAGIDRTHGLRHSYAITRYQELTGHLAPRAGGPTSKDLTEQQKVLDQEARLKISAELGHAREAITVNYLGR